MIDIRIGADAKHDSFPWETVNTVAPHLIWLFFAIGLLIWFGRARLDALLARVTKLSIAGIEVELKQTLRRAAELKKQDIPPTALGRAVRRLAQAGPLMAGARILWIDDNPGHNLYEQALFEEVGAVFDDVVSNDQAQAAIGRVAYDLIVSDIARNGEGDGKPGLAFARAMSQERPRIPILFYVGSVTGSVPEGAFGITNRPDELVHLVLDVLARQRG